RDITEQEQLRDQVNQADKLSALGEMAGGVAHDFNNFLTVILGNAQLLLGDSKLDSEDRELLKTIERVAGDAAETVRRVQEFTRVRTSRSFELVDVNQVIRNAIEVARPRWKDEADARGVAIGLELDIADVPWVRASESELGEVIVNLLVNAADATDKNGHISIASHVENDHVVVSVSDEGCGMSEEQLRRVFEPFYSTKGSGGSGLGLSVAYGIITRHGGKISAQSRKGKGSVFTVELPVVEPVETAEQTEAKEPVPVRAVRVLVIDDAVLIRRLLDGMLSGMGHQVETAGSGQDGIGLFEKAIAAGREFDLVLTDLGMPGMSGWDVAEIVKGASPETPVALITGWGDQLDPEKMKQSKVDAVIAKPFSLEQIRNLVGRIVPPIG
ncbi:MAG: hybrid sensor histidine kinase/response regulator, partial [Thermoleophilia bacterium]